jgi:hypothetical protein
MFVSAPAKEALPLHVSAHLSRVDRDTYASAVPRMWGTLRIGIPTCSSRRTQPWLPCLHLCSARVGAVAGASHPLPSPRRPRSIRQAQGRPARARLWHSAAPPPQHRPPVLVDPAPAVLPLGRPARPRPHNSGQSTGRSVAEGTATARRESKKPLPQGRGLKVRAPRIRWKTAPA